MSELHERHKRPNVIPDCQIKLSKIGIIEETHVPRSRWKFGNVEKFVTIKDGFNHGCKLRVIAKRVHYFIKRPVNKLYSLEIQNSDNSVVSDCSENDDFRDYGRANRPK